MKKIKNILKKYYVFSFIIAFLILIVILLGFYPGLVSYDSINQWNQVQSGIITDAHPFFSTFFMLILSKIWNSYTIVIIYQILLIALSWGYFCKVLEVNSKKKIRIIYLYTIFVFLNPLIALFSITLWKDIVYTSYLLLCAIILFDWSNKKFELSKKMYCLLGLIMSMAYNYRHNGKIVVILLLLIIYIIIVKKYIKKEINLKNFKKTIYILISFIAMLLITYIPKIQYLKSNEKIDNESNEVSISTIDGYMMWMMGAHLNENNIDNDEEKNFLNKIFPLEEWKNAYNPYLINNSTSSESIDKGFLANNEKKFQDIFIKYSLKHPLTIVTHYLKADSLLINPIATFQGYVYVYCYPNSGVSSEYSLKPIIPLVEKFYNKILNISFKKPFVLFYEPAIFLYLSIIVTILLAKKVYGKKIWLFSLPMLLNTISLVPINLAQDLRYVYINYLTFFCLLLILFINIEKLKIKKI